MLCKVCRKGTSGNTHSSQVHVETIQLLQSFAFYRKQELSFVIMETLAMVFSQLYFTCHGAATTSLTYSESCQSCTEHRNVCGKFCTPLTIIVLINY